LDGFFDERFSNRLLVAVVSFFSLNSRAMENLHKNRIILLGHDVKSQDTKGIGPSTFLYNRPRFAGAFSCPGYPRAEQCFSNYHI